MSKLWTKNFKNRNPDRRNVYILAWNSIFALKLKEEDKIKEDTVIKTEPSAGESSKYGSQIKIFIPQVEYKYPDFTKYSISELEEFVSKHELKLEYKYQEDLNKPEGTIIKQSRAKDSVVTPGATLVITVTTKPEESTDDGVVVEE